MFLVEEELRLQSLFRNIKKETIYDILSEVEVEAIENSSSSLKKLR